MAPAALSAQQAKPEAHGYFSFSYLQGRGEGEAARGSLEGLEGGLALTGLLTMTMDYRLEVRSRSEASFALVEAWLGFNLAKAFNVRAGLYLVPFGRYNRLNRPHENLFIQSPLVFEEAYPAGWRDLGLSASGQVSFVLYALSLGNGLGEDAEGAPAQQFRDNNGSKDVCGRLGIRWRQGIETAVSYSRQVFSSEGARHADYLGADASWVTENYHVLGEFVRAEREEAAGGRRTSEGWHVLLALDYKALWPTVGYQSLKTTPPEGPAAKRTRWTLGLAWAVFPGAWLKAEYAWNREPGAEIADDLLSLQLAASF
jgi:hypothetical protein